MDEQLQEDWLDARLREEARYIDDDGFTARVVRNLPAAPPRRSFRGAILLAITILASIATYFASNGGSFVIRAATDLARMPVLFIGLVAICAALIMTALAAGAAFSSIREQR